MNPNTADNNVLSSEGEFPGGDITFRTNSPNKQEMEQQQQQNINYNGMQPQQQDRLQQSQDNIKTIRKKPFVKITEQPASKALRFRYECEGRSAGSIPGVNSTIETKTYPTIEIVGYKGRAVVVVSCVTKDPPYRPHPHNLVGKEGCKKGVCTLEINSETMRAVFSNLGIQCVKKKDIESALKAREDIRVDPFKTGFTHRFQPSSIDLNAVRLCFQVFMESDHKGRFTQPLPPVVSDPIYDKKAMSELVISRLCSCTASVLGNTQIILLCEKVAKEDISVRFYEEHNDQIIWEAYGEFQHTDVHKQTAITFKTPRYHKIDITEPAKVMIQLKRPSDGATSESLPFEYVPLDSDPAHLKRKRQKTNGDPVNFLHQHQKLYQNELQDGCQAKIHRWNTANIPEIKTEPRDASPQPVGVYRVPPELTPSPQPFSPSNSYAQNTPSPYNVLQSGNITTQRLISPNQQYNITNTGGGSNTPLPLNITECNAYGRLTHPQQQQYHGSSLESTDAAHWESKFNVAVPAESNMSNLNNTNPFKIHNISTSPNSGAMPGNAPSNISWNLSPNNFPPHQHHLQQQYQHHPTRSENELSNNNGPVPNSLVNATDANITNNNEHGLTNLLTIDSEQYVRINSEDQQMLRLNSEDLQISNLSIST